MQKNSAHALDGTFVEPSEKLPGWPQFLPMERIKAGITEIALGLHVFAALVAFYCLIPKKDVTR
jgi:hypothetical protein